MEITERIGIAQERTTGSIYRKRNGRMEVETNKSAGFAENIAKMEIYR